MAVGLTFAPSARRTLTIASMPSPTGRLEAVLQAPVAEMSWPSLVVDAVAWLAVGLAVAMTVSDRTGRLRSRQLLAWLVIAPGSLAMTHVGRMLFGLQREGGAPLVQGVALGLGLAAGLAGVPLWRQRVTARSTRAAQLGLLVVMVGAAIAWTPASWAVDAAGAGPAVRWQQFVPMFSLATTNGMSSVFLVLQRAGLGAAIGACLAARKRLGAPVPGLRSVVAFAAVLELGQVVVPGRYADITDVLMTVAAAGLVLALVERADRGPDELEAASVVALNRSPHAGRF
jgi:hypothetical protein